MGSQLDEYLQSSHHVGSPEIWATCKYFTLEYLSKQVPKPGPSAKSSWIFLTRSKILGSEVSGEGLQCF